MRGAKFGCMFSDSCICPQSASFGEVALPDLAQPHLTTTAHTAPETIQVALPRQPTARIWARGAQPPVQLTSLEFRKAPTDVGVLDSAASRSTTGGGGFTQLLEQPSKSATQRLVPLVC